MCNCGNKRQQFAGAQPVSLSSHHYESGKNIMWDDVYFEYTGLTALSVKGNITGQQYRFNQTGVVQQIDYRDAAAMMAVPVLKKIVLKE